MEIYDFSVFKMTEKPKRTYTKYTAEMYKKQLMLMNNESEGKMMEILTGPKKNISKKWPELSK